MSNVIEVSNLYKEYNLGVIGHGTLYRDLQSLFARLQGKEDPNSIIGLEGTSKLKDKKILALQNINLKIKKGTVVGIIGHNGSGKSTLLKILSKITSPSHGEIRIKGRIASLLEVGTGFHPELTGRENIFLNAAINGMPTSETQKKIKAISAFSGVGKYLDTPIKRYSSGMEVRLGFSVAAHLDPDILIVDEVLAVGDALFKKKAIEKMNELRSTSKRTVLFVSHQLDSIIELCDRTIVLENGKIINDGNPSEMVNFYIASLKKKVKEHRGQRIWKQPYYSLNKELILKSIFIKDNNNKIKEEFDVTEEINIEVSYTVLKNEKLCCTLQFENSSGQWLFFAMDETNRNEWESCQNKSKGDFIATFYIPKNLFNEDIISINVSFFSPPQPPVGSNDLIIENQAISFAVVDKNSTEGQRGSFPFNWGKPAIRPFIKCETKNISI